MGFVGAWKWSLEAMVVPERGQTLESREAGFKSPPQFLPAYRTLAKGSDFSEPPFPRVQVDLMLVL